MSKIISLTKNKFTVVDDCDFEKLSQYRWFAHESSNNHYARGRTEIGFVYMHRFIMNVSKSDFIDHINGNGFDNRRSNLRICTQADNNKNQKLRSDNTTGYTGVNFDKRQNKWRARITNNGKEFLLGSFDSPEMAGIAYNHAARKYHKEFATYNNIVNWEKTKLPLKYAGQNNKTGYRGVSKCNNRWRSIIHVNKHKIDLGYFDTAKEAALAYDEMALKHYGKSAKLNLVNNYEAF